MEDWLSKSKIHLLHFVIQQVKVCIDIECVKKILPLSLIEEVPSGPYDLLGLLNVHEKAISVFDLAIRLNLIRSQPYSLETKIILLSNSHTEIALIADDILDLTLVQTSDIQMVKEFEKQHLPFIAIVPHSGHLSLLLNQNHLLNMNRMLENKSDQQQNIEWHSKNE